MKISEQEIRLQSIPERTPYGFRSVKKEEVQEGISGLRPLLNVEGIKYVSSDKPFLIWQSTMPGSWAHREIYHAAIITQDSQGNNIREDCFLYHRTNKAYQFWSIEPLDDYATLSVIDGVKLICSKHPSLDIDNPDLPLSTCLLQRDFANGQLRYTKADNKFIRAKGSFDCWSGIYNGKQGSFNIIPVKYKDTNSMMTGEIAWIKQFNGKDGSVCEEIMTFSEGWEFMRHQPNSGIRRAFSSIPNQ